VVDVKGDVVVHEAQQALPNVEGDAAAVPLLPLEELDRLRADPTYCWRTLSTRPEVLEALHLASPGLVRRLAAGAADDPGVAAAVTAYLVRMWTPRNPVRAVAGCVFGVVGEATALVVDGPEGTARHSRPVTEVLALARAVTAW
jgi:class I lanthipeptide synthase